MASNASGIRAGRAYAEIGANDTGLVSALKSAEGRLKAFGASVAGIGARVAAGGAAVVSPLLLAAKAFSDAGSELADASARTGVSVEALSELSHAAQQTGTDLGTVEGAVRKLQKNLVEAANGSQEAQAAFAALGLSAQQLLRLSPDQQFEAIARSIAAIPNPTAKAAIALQLLGKSGTAIIPLIDNMDALTQEARDLGLVMSKEDAEAADRLGDAFDNVRATLGRVVQVVGAALAPDLADLAESVARTVKTVIDFVAANRPLIVTVFKIAAGVVAAGTAIVALGAVISGVGSILGGIAAGITTIGAVLGAILSPLGLVAVGLATLTTWFLTSTTAGAQALAFLGNAFDTLKGDAQTAFGGIADALKAGDIALAGEILWATLQLEFARGIALVTGLWNDFGVTLADGFSEASTRIAGFMVDMWANIRAIWTTSLADLSGSWGSFVARILKLIGPLTTVFEKLTGISVADEIDSALKGVGIAPGERKDASGALGGIEADRLQQQQALRDQQEAGAAARRSGADDAVRAAQAQLDDAQARLKGLAGRASLEAAGVGAGPNAPAKPEFTPETLDAAQQQVKKTVDVSGGFSAAAFGRLGAGNSVVDGIKEQKKEQEKTTKELQKLNDKARTGRLVFTS